MRYIDTDGASHEFNPSNHQVLTELGVVQNSSLVADSALYEAATTILAGSEPGLVQSRETYSCTFVFSDSGVLLVRKNHPSWQAGRLNGIGGRAEKGETPLDCAIREFTEETGVAPPALRKFCTLADSRVIVHFFAGEWTGEGPETRDVNDRDEPIEWHRLNSEIMEDGEVGHPEWSYSEWAIENLSWLIPMARERFHIDAFVTAMRRDDNGDPVR